MNSDYLCEQKLRRQDKRLHKIFSDSVFSLQRLLIRYTNIFPPYTDHTVLHSLEVLDFCNALIGRKNIERLTK